MLPDILPANLPGLRCLSLGKSTIMERIHFDLVTSEAGMSDELLFHATHWRHEYQYVTTSSVDMPVQLTITLIALTLGRLRMSVDGDKNANAGLSDKVSSRGSFPANHRESIRQEPVQC
jgi:hypothetical protein